MDKVQTLNSNEKSDDVRMIVREMERVMWTCLVWMLTRISGGLL
jgi:hypothetical protein